MSSEVVDLDALRAQVTRQAATVKQLKADGAEQSAIQAAVQQLQALRKQLDELASTQETGTSKWQVDKRALDECIIRRMFVVPSFEIHGGVAGLYDYGPPGCALKENFLSLWRQHFILEDNLLQIECTTLTPYSVLKTSGHVDKFEDLMVKDVLTGTCYRADKLLEDFIDNELTRNKLLTKEQRDEMLKIAGQAGSYSAEQLSAKLQEFGVKAPDTGNNLTEPFRFNLMFQTSIGPSGNAVGFLRPETAQGMFVNFRRLYDYNATRLPMGVAQIGSAYRNEIAPRGGLLRVREFTMAEIEFFVNPKKKDHVKFETVKNLRLTLFPNTNQIGDGKTITPTLEEAVTMGIINNQTLAYFMARTALFLLRVGIKSEGLRFRQHLRTEMAHYACDCWDAEILMSQGWVECVGIADRSAFDLKVHADATGVPLVGREALPVPREEEVLVVAVNKKVIGSQMKGTAKDVIAALETLESDQAAAESFSTRLASEGFVEVPTATGAPARVTPEMVTFRREKRKVHEEKFIPNVIEPSFGIGRILTGIFEHNFSTREGDDQRAVLSFRPVIAPCKALVLPVDARVPLTLLTPVISALVSVGLSNTVDDSGASIGRRYARADELGIPFAITVDQLTATQHSVTVRERDTCAQIRVPIAEVPILLRSLCEETSTWADALLRYPVVTTGEDKAATAGAGSGSSSATSAAGAGAGSVATAATAHSVGATSVKGATAAAVATSSSTSTASTSVEGWDRTCGRFHRPVTAISTTPAH